MNSNARSATLSTIDELLAHVPRLRALHPQGLKLGYARVSTDDQHPEVQVDRLYAEGCHLVFADKGVSGRRARRPQFDAALDLLQPGDTLVAVRLDRIGRSMANLVDVTRHLDARGAGMLMLDQQDINTTGKIGKLLFAIIAAIAEFEADLIVERTRDGQAAVRRMGNLRRSVGGPPPLGFMDPGGDDNRDWMVNEPVAEALRLGAQLVLDDPENNIGTAYKAVRKALRKAAGYDVSEKMFRATLARPVSAGLITEPIFQDGKKVGYHTIGLAACGGPLDETTARELRSIFDSRKVGAPIETDRYPLGPALRCDGCGNQLTGEGRPRRNRANEITSEPIGYYACRNAHVIDGKRIQPCRGVSVNVEDLHEMVGAMIDEWSTSDAATAAAARGPQLSTRAAKLVADRAMYVGRMDAITDKHNRDRMSDQAFAEQERYLEAQLDLIDDELDALTTEARAVPALQPWATMTGPNRLKAVYEVLQTPIIVGRAPRGYNGSAAERVTLEYRDPPSK